MSRTWREGAVTHVVGAAADSICVGGEQWRRGVPGPAVCLTPRKGPCWAWTHPVLSPEPMEVAQGMSRATQDAEQAPIRFHGRAVCHRRDHVGDLADLCERGTAVARAGRGAWNP